jgi:hypothetical protein
VDATFRVRAKRAIIADLERWRWLARRNHVYLVSYPRSGSTLLRSYFSILQGRPQYAAYHGDIVWSGTPAINAAFDHIALIKTHQFPADDKPMLYLVRDGRNATLSHLYLTFLWGGHRYSRLTETYDGIRHLDRAEGSWARHVEEALRQCEQRSTLFLRYEDLVRSPEEALLQAARFTGAELSLAELAECVARHRREDRYATQSYSGYLYEPEPNSIYDILKQHRGEDYWRHIFDSQCRKYFHRTGATAFLLRFGYEQSADWWRQPRGTVRGGGVHPSSPS